MNKKGILLFLLGVLSTALVFGVAAFVQSKAETPATLSQKAALPAAPLQETPSAPPAATAVETPAFTAFIYRTPGARSVVHAVKPGENLTAISKKYNVTVDLIKKINGLSGDRLMAGAKLTLPTAKLSVVVDKSQNTLILKGDEEVLKTYVVSTGKNNNTPVGVFKITNKLLRPIWYRDGRAIPYGDPENILGTRWLGLDKQGYGLHGTTEPEKLGQQVTAGCVRLRNQDVEELYSLLPAGTEVTIVD